MGTWVTADDLKERYSSARIDRVADRGDSTLPDDVIAAAIEDAEGEARSSLLGRFTLSDLPTNSTDASPTLKRVVERLALYSLYEPYDTKPQDVVTARAAARDELAQIVHGGISLLIAGEPAVDTARMAVATSRRAATTRERPITLAAMDDWGR